VLYKRCFLNVKIGRSGNGKVNWLCLARKDVGPTKKFLRENIYFIDEMLSSYPTWLAMVTKYENLQTWHQRALEYKFFQPPTLNLAQIDKFFTDNEWSPFVLQLLVVFLMALFFVYRI